MTADLGLEGSLPITRVDIEAAEARLGFALPPELTALCLHENGGMPRRCWYLSDEREYWINWFYPIEPVAEPETDGIVHVYQQLTGEGLLPSTSIPFACDAGNNNFLVDRVDGHVWYMPMDEWHQDETPEQNWKRSGYRITESLAEFLDALTDQPPEWALD